MSGNKNNQGGASGSDENSQPKFGDTLDANLLKSRDGGSSQSEPIPNEIAEPAPGPKDDGTLEPDPEFVDSDFVDSDATIHGDSDYFEDDAEEFEDETSEVSVESHRDSSFAPKFLSDSSHDHEDALPDDADILKVLSSASTFVGDSSAGDDVGAADEAEFLGDPSDAPTFLGDSSAHDQTNVYSESLGRDLSEEEELDADAKSSDSKDSASPRRLSSQVWGSGSRSGLDASLTIRNRPVKGGAPFGNSADADYEIIRVLAEGGMGIVYIARQLSLNRQLAIKTLKPMNERERQKLSQAKMSQVTRQRREMFLSEALVTANLVHPNIVPIHDLCQTDDGTPFYSMKQVEGTPWNKVINSKTQEENLEVLLKVADAVAYAHHNGVINRDLKPENIMLGEFGEVIVLDWGLSVPAPDSGKSKFASPSTSIGAGTPAYMAPELWVGPPDKIGRGSDIYLLGAILYEMLAKHPPHAFPKPPEHGGRSTLFQIIDSVIRPNAIVPTDIKGELMDIAMHAMQTRPEDRFQSVQEFQLAIRNFQRHEESRTLTNRADDLVRGKAVTAVEGYSDFQTACALYEEALRGWKGNEKAEEGLFYTQLKYAQLAYSRGDFDLGLQMVGNRRAKEFVAVREQLTKAKTRRGRQKVLTVASIIAFLVALVGGAGGVSWFGYQAQKARYVAEKALDDLVTKTGELEVAEAKKKQAEDDAEKADIAAKAASGRQEDAELAATMAKADADAATQEAKTEKASAEMAREAAKLANDDAIVAKAKAVDAVKEADDAKADAAVAKRDAAVAKRDADAAKLTAAQSVLEAELNIQQVEVSSLVRSGDFGTAITKLNELLNGKDLATLPEEDRQERVRELNAQKDVLEEKARNADAVTQTMAVSKDERRILWGRTDGTIELWNHDPSSPMFPDAPSRSRQLSAGDKVVDLRLVETESLSMAVAACGSKVYLWNLTDDTLQSMSNEDEAAVTAIEVSREYVFAAVVNNAKGKIQCWRISNQTLEWEYPTGTELRDLAIIPGMDVLIYAGSRSDLSADVVAVDVASGKPEKPLGQLRYTPDNLRPPQCISVSPKGSFLVISNSRDGEILVLPRAAAGNSSGFPFQSPAEFKFRDGWTFLEHSRPVTSIAFSSDETMMLTGSEDRTAGVWTISRKSDNQPAILFDPARRLTAHGAPVTAAVFLGQSNHAVVTSSLDHYSRLWDLNTYNAQNELNRALDPLNKKGPAGGQTTQRPRPAKRHEAASSSRQRASKMTHWMTTSLPAEPAKRLTVLNASPNRILAGRVQSIDLSSGGNVAVTGGISGTAVMWDTTTGNAVNGGQEKIVFHDRGNLFEEGHKFNMSRLAFLPDMKFMLTASFDGSLCLWDVDRSSPSYGTERTRLTGTRLLNAFAISPMGDFIVTTIESPTTSDKSASNDAVAMKPTFDFAVWEFAELLKGGDPKWQIAFRGFHKQDITAISVSPDASRIATADRDGRVAVWSRNSNAPLVAFRAHEKLAYVTGLEWVSEHELVSAGLDGAMKVWVIDDAAEGTLTAELSSAFQKDNSIIDRIAASRDRKQILTVSVSRSSTSLSYAVRLWQIGQAESLGTIRLATSPLRETQADEVLERVITAINWSADGKQVAIAVRDSLTKKGKNNANIQTVEPLTTAMIVSTADWKVQEVVSSPSLPISDIAFGVEPLEKTKILATFDGTSAHLWDRADGSHLIACEPQRVISAVALSQDPEHKLLATGTRSLLVFNAQDGDEAFGQTLFKSTDAHEKGISALAFSPMSAEFRLVSGGNDGVVRLWEWDAEQQKLNQLFAESPEFRKANSVVDVDWTVDGEQVLAVTRDSVSLIRVADGSYLDIKLPEFMNDLFFENTHFQCGSISILTKEDLSKVECLAVAGKSASGSVGYVLTMDINGNGLLHSEISGHGFGGITAIRFVPGTPYIATTGADGAAILWNWQPRRESGTQSATEAFRFIASGKRMSDAHRGPIRGLAVSNNGSLATCSDDGTAIYWTNPLAP